MIKNKIPACKTRCTTLHYFFFAQKRPTSHNVKNANLVAILTLIYGSNIRRQAVYENFCFRKKKLKYKNKFKPNAVAEVADLITLKHELKKQMIKLGI